MTPVAHPLAAGVGTRGAGEEGEVGRVPGRDGTAARINMDAGPGADRSLISEHLQISVIDKDKWVLGGTDFCSAPIIWDLQLEE